MQQEYCTLAVGLCRKCVECSFAGRVSMHDDGYLCVALRGWNFVDWGGCDGFWCWNGMRRGERGVC